MAVLTMAKLGWDEFLAQRERVVSLWPTLREVDLGEGVARQRALPAHKVARHVFAEAHAAGKVLTGPRFGVPILEDQIGMLLKLQEMGADILPTTTDPLTRHQKYTEAETALQRSIQDGKHHISGYPVLAHGLKATRGIVDAVDRPLCVRQGSSDPRPCYEIYLAAGYTSAMMGALQNLAFEKDVPMEVLIRNYQYFHRLVGYYEEHGCPILMEMVATLTGTLIPPCIAQSVSILDTLLAAQQGVRRFGMSYGLNGNASQDIATLRLYPEIARKYLSRLGHDDVEIYTVASQWMGDFPQQRGAALATIAWGTLVAALSPATEIIIKSVDEAFGVPSEESYRVSFELVRPLLEIARAQALPSSPAMSEEVEMLRRETSAIVDRVLELGEGDVATGVVRGLEAGVIDIPWSPTRYNLGRALPVRDCTRAVRFLDTGNLPFDDEVKEFHRQKLSERAAREHRSAGYEMLVDDVMWLSKGLVP